MEVKQMSEVAVVFPLAEMQVGDTYVLNDIPLHLTVLSDARINSPILGFVEEVRRVAEGWAPFTAEALDFQLFGPARNIPVTEVTVVPTLRRLHESLCEVVRSHGGEAVEPAYWGEGFRAHVTKTQRGLSVAPGEDVWLDRLAVIDCSEPIRSVIWVETLAASVR
jgi:2'-5' RNA ligase